MQLRFLTLVVALGSMPGISAAQESQTPTIVPAERLLQMRADLALDDKQVERLRALAKTQSTTLSRATGAYLRAEADVVETARTEDALIRRAALEKRARAAIDAEMSRLQAEKEARDVLAPAQLGRFLAAAPSDESRRAVPLWAQFVAPAPLASGLSAEPDSADVRISASPLITEIYLSDRLVGTGRLTTRLPIGDYLLKFRTPACLDTLRVVVAKGPPLTVAHRMSCGTK